MELPHDYIVDKVYLLCKRPIYKRSQKVYNFECPICKEGKSAGKKRRGIYFEESQHFFCHNCNQSWSVIDWLNKVEGLLYSDILKESAQYSNTLSTIDRIKQPPQRSTNTATLPLDCINLTDKQQVQYHQHEPIVQEALQYLRDRRLLTAVNRCKYFYVTLTDFKYSNRLIIPFFDETGQIIFYQARALHEEDEKYGKYISKTDGDRSLFGIDRINPTLDYLFMFEGPIDSMFVVNGLGICGIHLSEVQLTQLQKYYLYTKIWVLDNQLDNQEVINKYKELIETGERVFIWPAEYDQYKDINDICTAFNIDQISPKFFIKNSYTGAKALEHLDNAVIHQLTKHLV